MPPAKAALKREPASIIESVTENAHRSAPASVSQIPQRRPNALAGTEALRSQVRAVVAIPLATPIARPRRNTGAHFQARVPVITGEAVFRGAMSVDGIITGQLGATGSTLAVKQRPRSGPVLLQPDLNGELDFKDMLRVNGYIAGKVTSQNGTLIVDPSARVDADIEVGVALISGIVNGDVIAHERVDLGPEAIINGNISTRSLTMKPGAVFQGDCRMLTNGNGDK